MTCFLSQKIIPYVREGGTAVIPVKERSHCQAMKLDEEQVILPRQRKGGGCRSMAEPVCHPSKRHKKFKVSGNKMWGKKCMAN